MRTRGKERNKGEVILVQVKSSLFKFNVIGDILSVTLKSNFVLFSCIMSNMVLNDLGMIPGFFCSLSPTMVKVFPEPVWPYAKIQTL